MQIAKGYWQKALWSQLESGKAVRNPMAYLKGRAKNYWPRYEESFRNMLKRAQAAGYVIERTPGVRGGEWSATYRVVKQP